MRPLFVLSALLLVACAPAEPGAVEISVLSFNLRHNVDCYEERMELIADGIAALAPDVIGLQEIEIAAEQGEWLYDMLLERGLDYELRQLGKGGLAGALTGEGIGVMSLHEVIAVERVDLSEGRVSLLAEIALGDKGLKGANVEYNGTTYEAEVRVSRQSILALFTETGDHEVSVTGELADGVNFAGAFRITSNGRYTYIIDENP